MCTCVHVYMCTCVYVRVYTRSMSVGQAPHALCFYPFGRTPEPLFSITAVFLSCKSRVSPCVPAYCTLIKGYACVVPRAQPYATCASWIVAEWMPPLPSPRRGAPRPPPPPPVSEGSPTPAPPPLRADIAGFGLPTLPAVLPCCMHDACVSVRALAGCAPVRSLRRLPLRFAQTSPASFAPPAHPASV